MLKPRYGNMAGFFYVTVFCDEMTGCQLHGQKVSSVVLLDECLGMKKVKLAIASVLAAVIMVPVVAQCYLPIACSGKLIAPD
jgi:hypothetical protein